MVEGTAQNGSNQGVGGGGESPQGRSSFSVLVVKSYLNSGRYLFWFLSWNWIRPGDLPWSPGGGNDCDSFSQGVRASDP